MLFLLSLTALLPIQAAPLPHYEAHYFKSDVFSPLHPPRQTTGKGDGTHSTKILPMGKSLGQEVAVKASKLLGPKDKVGVLLAGNSGLAGGNMGHEIKLETYKTQEEDMMAAWFIAQADITDKKNLGKQDRENSKAAAVYRENLKGRWGMKQQGVAGDRMTIQGVDYTKASAKEYASVWMVEDARMVSRVGQKFLLGERSLDNLLLTFVAGPNCGSKGRGAKSTMTRTMNAVCDTFSKDDKKGNPKKMTNAGKTLLDEGRKAALRAGLYGMAARGVRVAVVADVSGGIYAGAYRKHDHNGKFHAKTNPDWITARALVEDLLEETVTSKGGQKVKLAAFFDEVHVPGYGPKGSVVSSPTSSSKTPSPGNKPSATGNKPRGNGNKPTTPEVEIHEEDPLMYDGVPSDLDDEEEDCCKCGTCVIVLIIGVVVLVLVGLGVLVLWCCMRSCGSGDDMEESSSDDMY